MNNHTLPLEQSLLGTAIMDPKSVDQIIDQVPIEAIQSPENRVIFQGIKSLHITGNKINFTSLANKLSADEKIDKAGGYEYLVSLLGFSDPIQINRVIDQVRTSYLNKNIRSIVSSYQSQMIQPGADLLSLQQQMRNELETAEEMGSSLKLRDEFQVAQELLNKAIYNRDHNISLLGYDTGFEGLNKFLDGLQKKNLIVLAARPSMGKTSLVINLKRNLSNLGLKGVFFSLDSNATNMLAREASNQMFVSVNRLRKGILNELQWKQLMEFVEKKKKARSWISDEASMAIEDIREQTRRAVNMGAKYIIVDYIQQVTTKNCPRNKKEMDYISLQFKAIAKDFDIPVIAIAQLNRSVETRGGSKRPILSDLRESGQIEQDADSVLFLWRPAYYGITEDDAGRPLPEGYAEVIVAKQKDGPTGSIGMRFNPEYMGFEDFDMDDYHQDSELIPVDDNMIAISEFEEEEAPF